MNYAEEVYEAGARVQGIKLYANEALQLWRQHADTEHDTPKSVYRFNVVGWHRKKHPDCGWDIGAIHWNNPDRHTLWTGTDGVTR